MAREVMDLEDELGVWQKLIVMLSDQSTAIEGVENASLRPPLEREPAAGGVALPSRIDWLPERDENSAVYRLLSLQVAGRREFGTYAYRSREGCTVVEQLRPSGSRASALEEIFLLAEGVRVQHRVGQAYPGSAADTARTAASLLVCWRGDERPTRERVYDTLFTLALARPEPGDLPVWLPLAAAERALRLLAPLEREGATVETSLAVAARLARWLSDRVFARGIELGPSGELDTESESERLSLGQLTGDDEALPTEAELNELEAAGVDAPAAPEPADAELGAGGGKPSDGSAGRSGLQREQGREADDERPATRLQRLRKPRPPTEVRVQSYLYDEWDCLVGDYRRRHCRVHELALPSDSGAFFERSLHENRAVLAEVRRQFERMRPEAYRPLRRLEDGEDFDLNALTEARIESRAGRSPDGRIYTRRMRQARDVATLFLLDMSASTEQPFAEPEDDPPPRRIIDTLKAALVVMTTALDTLGDNYAIYGFSSQGRHQVEVYPVKSFGEGLTVAVKGRIGGIEPKTGTRMGPALRHSSRKLAAIHAQAKHLILLSDGFPQDQEYGPDRRSHTYGLQDTAVALREVSAAGATPFCITVDRDGHDYLRKMCDTTQYLIIDELEELPRELPKVYRRVVRS